MLTRELRQAVKEDKIRYYHFNVLQGAATVAMYDQGGDTYYGVSFCSPEDNFCRATGRLKARRRLFSIQHPDLPGPWRGCVVVGVNKTSKLELATQIIKDILITNPPPWSFPDLVALNPRQIIEPRPSRKYSNVQV